MSRALSIYLDLVRFVAACAVVIYHSNVRWLISDPLPASNYGHPAVLAFFVLSGFVIAHVRYTKETKLIDFTASRMARIYSLAIPVVVLVPLLDVAGRSLMPSIYVNAAPYDLWFVRIVSSLMFTNEIWSVSIMTFSDTPYWSLCYEVWYYVLFAACTFFEGKRRVFLIAAICLLLGPKILLLAPIWGLGVLIYRWKALQKLSEPVGMGLWIASLLALWLFHRYALTEYFSEMLKIAIGAEWHRQMTFSKLFIGDYLLGIIFAANFVGFRAIAHRFEPLLLFCKRPIVALAAYTFTLYIFHQPLILFWGSVWQMNPHQPYFYAAVLLSAAFSIFLIGLVTEGKRHLWKAWARARLHSVNNILKLHPGRRLG